MKTLVVLSALVAVALAAPALLEGGSETIEQTITNIPKTFIRERKSPQEASQSAPGLQHDAPTSQISEIGISGRSFGLKKPIIIKKKLGHHHVYRDSDEEQAEPGETCGKQVKVKLCDVKSEDKMRSSTNEDMETHMTEEDMKHSIKLAKEAVENLQRDLKVVERKPNVKSTVWKHGNTESDAELHQDIEVAREALEHIHKNFENLESTSLQSTMLKDADSVKDIQLQSAKNENQRLAQWKEAMDTIQKNFEIAKNIEDSFKSASDTTGFIFTEDTTTNDNTNAEPHKMINSNMRTTNDMIIKEDNKVTCKTEHPHEKSSDKVDTKIQLTEDDMTPAASTMSEKKIEDLDMHKGKHASEAAADTQKPGKQLKNSPMQKNADMDTKTLENLNQKNNLVSDSMKKMEENKEKKSEPELGDKKLSIKENTDSLVAESSNKMKSVETEDMLFDQQRNGADNDHLQKSLKLDQHLRKTENNPAKQHLEMKSAEHFDKQHNVVDKKATKLQETLLHTDQPKEVDTSMFVKSVEDIPTDTHKGFIEKETQQNLEQHFTRANQEHSGNMRQQTGMFAPPNIDEQMQLQQHKQSLLHSEMREVNDLKNMNQHQQVDPSQTRWAEDKNLQPQMDLMKSADSIHPHTMDHHHTLKHSGQHQHVHHTSNQMKNQHFEPLNGQLHSRFPDNFIPQGKSADMDMQSYYMNMRDGSGTRPENHRFRWQQMHNSARSAYGAAAAPVSAPSGSAVGLFPNANVGGCGIPLLLSCNPSVVHGSLAKPAPYSAPAYRTEEDFNLHSKRDVTKSHENLPKTLHLTPDNLNVKTNAVLFAKQ